MRHFFFAAVVAATAFLSSNAFAADPMSMSAPAPMAMSAAYKFELASPVQSKSGRSVVSVRLVHAMDKKPVIGAIIIQSRADMGPGGMASMNAPIKALPVTTPGVYSFEIQNGLVWKKADKWALTFAAKVQGEAATVSGSLVVELKP
jgi:Cu(I)/Ag(I) efflux system membrane fusion protein